MTAPNYLLAKYIPDLKRIEPRNVGVILWTPRGVRGRFLFERLDVPGEVDGRSVPNWIGNLTAYKQWVSYWREAISSETYEVPTGGAAVQLLSPEFISAIQQANRGNFVLVEGGVLLDDIPEDELDDACKYLFETLVGEPSVEAPRDLTLDERWEDALAQVQLKSHRLYRRNYEVPTSRENFIFSDAIANGQPKRLYERVPFATRPRTFTKNAHHAAWQFEKITQAGVIAPEHTGAIISLTPDQEYEHRGRIAALRSVTRVINVRRQEELFPEAQQLAQIAQEEEQLVGTDETELRQEQQLW